MSTEQSVDLYSILGVSEDATGEEIKKAYNQLMKRYRPDLISEEDEDYKRLQLINMAYDTLKDATSRFTYDTQYKNSSTLSHHELKEQFEAQNNLFPKLTDEELALKQLEFENEMKKMYENTSSGDLISDYNDRLMMREMEDIEIPEHNQQIFRAFDTSDNKFLTSHQIGGMETNLDYNQTELHSTNSLPTVLFNNLEDNEFEFNPDDFVTPQNVNEPLSTNDFDELLRRRAEEDNELDFHREDFDKETFFDKEDTSNTFLHEFINNDVELIEEMQRELLKDS